MQQPNASPLKPSLGLPIPSSPADSGFLPRREFLPSSSKRPLSTFSLLTFTNTSSLRLAAFSQPAINALHRFFEERKLLRMFRDNRSPLRDKDDIERDRGPESRGFDRPEDEDLAEFTLTAKFWANPKAVETEKLMIQILILLNSLGYALLSSIDFAREPGDKLTLVFERHISGTQTQTQSPGQQFVYHTNGSTVSHQQPPHSGSLLPISGNGVQQQIFGISFTSQTSFRCICPPLESTPGVLQALRNAWPKGVEVENKVADGCYEFKLKGYAFFAEDTFQTDSLALILSLLKSLQRLQFTLIASLSLSNSHARSKDLWLFSATDTEALSPHQLLNSISSSPASYIIGSGAPGASFPSRQYSGEKDEKKLGTIGHLRSASADTNQSSSTIFAPGHQRHATSPTFGTNQGNTISPSGTITNKLAPRQQGSVLVKKSSKTSPKPTASGGLPLADPNVTPPGAMGRTNTPPKNTTPPGAATSPFPGSSMNKPGALAGLPAIAPKPTAPKHQFQQQQQQQVLYSTPTSGNVLYSTSPSSPPNTYGNFPPPSSSMVPQYMPPSSLTTPFVAPGPPPASPNVNITAPSPPASPPPGKDRSSSPQKQLLRPNAIDMPSTSFNKEEDEGDGPTPPLLSSATFRDTMVDHDRDTTTSVLSGRSGESFEVPVMWTGGLGGVGLGPTLEEKEEEEEEATSREGVASISSVPAVPGGWIEESPQSSNITPKPRTTKDSGRPSQEKARTFDAKVDGAQIVNVVPPEHESIPDGTTVVGGGANELQRRKSQEAVVHTLPGGSGDPKKDGWVMVNVSGDQQRNKVSKPSAVSRRTTATAIATATANVSSPDAASSTPPTTSEIIAPPAPAFMSDALGSGSGEESSSSHDRKDRDANALKPGSTTNNNITTTTTSKKGGFRRLFSRGDKDKDKEKERDKDKGSEKVSPDSTPGVKRLRWGPVTTEPAGGVRRSTID